MMSPADATRASGAHATYRKTAAGAAEIAHRQVLLEPQKRSVLLLLDGRRTVREVAQTLRLEPAIAEGVVAELVHLGLAQEVPPLAAAADPVGGPSKSELERVFARYLGPLAPIVLAKHLREARDRPDLIARLSTHLTDDSLRAAFVAEASRLR